MKYTHTSPFLRRNIPFSCLQVIRFEQTFYWACDFLSNDKAHSRFSITQRDISRIYILPLGVPVFPGLYCYVYYSQGKKFIVMQSSERDPEFFLFFYIQHG